MFPRDYLERFSEGKTFAASTTTAKSEKRKKFSLGLRNEINYEFYIIALGCHRAGDRRTRLIA